MLILADCGQHMRMSEHEWVDDGIVNVFWRKILSNPQDGLLGRGRTVWTVISAERRSISAYGR